MSKADHSPWCVVIIQSTKSLKITKRWRKGGLTGSPNDCVSWAIYLLPFVPLSLRPSDPRHQLSSIQAFKLHQQLFWVSSLQIMGLLSLYIS